MSDPHGIGSVAHLAEPDGFHTYVLTNRSIDHLVDFVLDSQIDRQNQDGLNNITVLAGHGLLCLDANNNSLVRLDYPLR